MLKKIAASLSLSLIAVGLAGSVAGCNTIKGIGADVERGGEKLENAADKAKK